VTTPEDTPSSDTIPLENLRRLDLKPGETLLLALPATFTMEQVARCREIVTSTLAVWHPGCNVLVIPAEADVSVVPSTEEPQ
jgi:hypothetical protein